jgi:threonine synthase
MGKFIGYRCSLCFHEYLPDQVAYVCPADGGNLDVVLDYESLRQNLKPEEINSSMISSLWRYLSLLPVANPGGVATPLWAVGYTPVFNLHRIAKELDLRDLWLKDESFNPTASFKDRASAVVVARAIEINAKVVVTASTGNAGAALAGMAAAVGKKAVIFAPRTAPPAKIAQLLIYGAQVILIDGSYDQAFDLTIQAAREFGWYCRNTGYNPFTIEGKKTAAFEIWEWSNKVPRLESRDTRLVIFVPVGDGNIISGIHKGFKDLLALGWIEQIPRLMGVQAEGSAAISNAFIAGDELIKPVTAKTLADSISVDLPRDGVRAVRAARQTDGAYVLVSDDEILAALARLGQVGVFAEPAGATSFAGLIKARQSGLITETDPVLVLNTGSGLKDVKAAIQAVAEAPIIEPTMEALKRMLQ